MTATLKQGSREEKLTANRTLERFLSPERQRLLGFAEFPSDLDGVAINGQVAKAWDSYITDGDMVVIKLPEEAIGVSAVSVDAPPPISSAPVPTTANASSEELALRAENLRLKRALRNLLTGPDGLDSVMEFLTSIKDDRASVINKIDEINSELEAIDFDVDRIKELLDAHKGNLELLLDGEPAVGSN